MVVKLFVVLLVLIVNSNGKKFNKNLYKDSSQPIIVRVNNLLSQMTLNEKIYQLLSVQTSKYLTTYKYGLGRIDVNGSNPQSIITQRNKFQQEIINNSRLNIPVSFHEETLHSCCPGGTVFPMPIMQGCTWNNTLIENIASIIAYEARTVGIDVFYTPVLNLWTDARFGRISEGFSSNPTLTSFYARSAVKGYQNDNASGSFSYLPDNKHGISSGKHYAAYGGALGGLNAAPSDISARTMFEVYLKPWNAFGKSGGRGAMASHQTYNRVPMHSNKYLLTDTFRYNPLFNFSEGVIVSDCNDIGVLQDYRIANNKSQAGARALIGGVDLDLVCGDPSSSYLSGSYLELESAINSGWINESLIDKSVSRVLAAKFAVGLFDNDTFVTDTNEWKHILNNKTSQELAYTAAVQGITLLQANENKFPSNLGYSLNYLFKNGNINNISIIGPNAKCNNNPKNKLCDTQKNMLGPYTQEDSNISVPTVYDAFVSKYNNSLDIFYTKGVDIQSYDISDIPNAVNLAQTSDVTVLVLGDSTSTCGEWIDNNNLDPPGEQLTLLNSIATVLNNTNKILIVVLIHGRPYTFGADNGNNILNNIDLLFSMYRCGEEGGNAIVDVIMGVSENSGRLSQAWPKSVGDVNSGSSPYLQTIRGKWVANTRSSPDLDGRYYDSYQNEYNMLNEVTSPLFPLGYGLSNTGCNMINDNKNGISYNNLATKMISNDNTYIFSVYLDVINNCNIGATDVIEIYLIDPPMLDMSDSFPILTRYWSRLIGYEKVYIESLSSVNIKIDIRFDDVAIYTDNTFNNFNIIHGIYTIRVGPNSRDTYDSSTITL